jgi:hypothetical protein
MRDVVPTVLPVVRLAFAPLAFALAGAAIGCGSDTPDIPANPTYTKDVKPILDANCIRCHGTGDMLHLMIVNGYPNSPSICYLQRYEDEGDCTDPNNPACKHGAKFCGTRMGADSLITSMINLPNDSTSRMPPPEADPLTDREKEIINRWSTASPAQ